MIFIRSVKFRRPLFKTLKFPGTIIGRKKAEKHILSMLPKKLRENVYRNVDGHTSLVGIQKPAVFINNLTDDMGDFTVELYHPKYKFLMSGLFELVDGNYEVSPEDSRSLARAIRQLKN